MNTETTVNNETRGWIFFDADCQVCARSAARVSRLLERLGFRLLPLQTPGTAARLGVSTDALVAIFDVRPYLTNWFLRLGDQATNVVFLYLVLVYALAAWKGGRL